MDELTKLVQQKAGLSEQQSQAAVKAVLDFLKSKLPAPIASQIDGVISGKTDLGSLGGMFGQH